MRRRAPEVFPRPAYALFKRLRKWVWPNICASHPPTLNLVYAPVIKQKYTILQSVLPIIFIGHKDDIGNATVDKLVRVCCCMVNLCPVVPQD